MLNSGNTLRLDNASSWQEIFVRGAAYLRNSALGLCRRPRHATRILGLGAELAPLRFGDAALAHEMARGKFSFGGVTVTGIPTRIFHLMPVNSAWSSSLQSLEWLRHFVASDQELHRIVARSLVLKWGEQKKSRWPAVAQIRALMALSLSAHFLIGQQPSGFRESFYALLEKQIARVLRCVQRFRPISCGRRWRCSMRASPSAQPARCAKTPMPGFALSSIRSFCRMVATHRAIPPICSIACWI